MESGPSGKIGGAVLRLAAMVFRFGKDFATILLQEMVAKHALGFQMKQNIAV